MVRLRVAAVIVAVLTANTAVQAQDHVGDRTEGLAENSNQDCSRSPGQSQSPGRSADLSEQLSQSNGVICPPAGVDPKMATPPRAGDAMPVIPPPGTPGGDPNTVPK
jgi:hypothetical protein